MLGKLMKHEWQDTWKIPVIILAALWVLSVATGFTFASPIFSDDYNGGIGVLVVLVWGLYYFAMIGTSLGIMLYLAVRFYKSMYTDEGYLTHTLPVTTDQLLLSKMIPMAVWTLLATLGIFVGIAIVGGMAYSFLGGTLKGEDMQALRDAMEEMRQVLFGSRTPLLVWIGGILMIVAGCIYNACVIAGSISIGQLLGKHKILGSIGAYFLVTTVLQVISTIASIPMIMIGVNSQKLDTEMELVELGNLMSGIYLETIIICLLVGIGLYFISRHLAKKKLNLD